MNMLLDGQANIQQKHNHVVSKFEKILQLEEMANV